MKLLQASWPRLKKRIVSRKKKILFLDFDGTLTPIVKTPDAVFLKKKVKDILNRLEESHDFILCLISGRSIQDLKKYFSSKRWIYIGNHGFEWKAVGIPLPKKVKEAKKLKALIWLMAENLKGEFRGISGVLVEDKEYTLSCHFRNVRKAFLPLFRQKITDFKKKYAHLPLGWHRGKKVWSVRPKMEWDKGAAALHLCRQFPSALPIAVGDDTTDEDMFRVLKERGLTIRVGRSRKSSADYYLKSPKAVTDFLKELSKL